MDPATATLIVAAFQLILIPIVAGVWYYYRDRVQNDKLKEAIDTAIRAAEEMSAAREKSGDDPKLTSNEKLDYVFNSVSKKFPDIKSDELERLIHGAIQKIPGIGATK